MSKIKTAPKLLFITHTLYRKNKRGQMTTWKGSLHLFPTKFVDEIRKLAEEGKITPDEEGSILSHFPSDGNGVAKRVNADIARRFRPILVMQSGLVSGKKRLTFRLIRATKRGFETVFDYAPEVLRQEKDKRLKQGFLPTTVKAESFVNMKPMLLNRYEKRKAVRDNLSEYFVQPKFDGIRMIVRPPKANEIGTDSVTKVRGPKGSTIEMVMTTRSDTIVHNFKRVLEELVQFPSFSVSLYFDGELYSDDLDLQDINSIVRKEKNLSEKELAVQETITFYIFDIVDMRRKEEIFEERLDFMRRFFSERNKLNRRFGKTRFVKQVPTWSPLSTEKELAELNQRQVAEGKEGLVLRHKSAKYIFGHRAMNEIVKFKVALKERVILIDWLLETAGDRAGAIMFICRLKGERKGGKFKVVPKGTLAARRKIGKKMMKLGKKEKEDLVGAEVQIKFYSYTRDGLPRHAVARIPEKLKALI